MTPTSPSQAEDAGAATGPYVGLADGVELVGEFAGSGYREPPRLVYRGDGQVVRLTPVLYHLVEAFDRQRTAATDDPLADAAAALSRTTGREFTGAHVAYLCDEKLAPMGVTTYGDGSPPRTARARPYLALKFRVAVLPARATWVLGGALMWLFRPAAMAVVLAAAVTAEVWAVGTRHPGAALEQTIMTPTGILAVLGLVLASTAFHEIGHATACRYGGVRPGAMGCGIYLVWPAFYTDITDTYRLGRAGRLRADFGGVYFNAVFLTVVTVAYAVSGTPALLVAVLAINIEIIQQLLPTLRFDGYYIVADIVGIPDLFTYIGAILRRTVLRRAPDERLAALKRWPQTVVTVWVLVVIPVLLVQLGYLITRLPYLVATDVGTIRGLVTAAVHAPDPVLAGTAAAVRTLLLALPVIGVALVVAQLARAGVRLIVRFAARRFGRRTRAARAVGARRGPRRFGLAAAAAIVATAAAWTLATGSTPDPAPVAAPTHAPAPSPPSQPGTHSRPAHSPAPDHDHGHDPAPPTPSRSYDSRHTPVPHASAPGTHLAPAPHTGGHRPGPATHAPGTHDPATHGPPRTNAPRHSARPSPTPSRTCAVRLPILPIGIGCD